MKDKEFAVKFGTGIKRAREGKGLSLKMMARDLNIAEITLRQYESGLRTPPLSKATEICRYLNTTVDNAVDTEIEKETKDD